MTISSSQALLVIFLLLLLPTITFSQENQISGFILDSLGTPIESATVTLSAEDQIISFAISDETGRYNLSFQKETNVALLLQVRSLGYLKFSEVITNFESGTQVKDIVLYPKTENLDEVLIVESQRPMQERNDTITYDLNFYTDKTEQTVEDVLKQLPGIEVETDGTIKYLNKEISKMLIDGDDLVDDQYTLLSKNLDSDLLKNVQVLLNYDENPLRKKFGKGKDVAINLSIKEERKNILFGKVSGGGGSKERYKIKTNLGLLRDQFKVLNLNQINNVGEILEPKPRYDNIDFQGLWVRNSKKEANGDFPVNNEIRQPAFLRPFESVRNQSEMASLTSSYNWTSSLSSRGLLYYTRDRINFNSESSNVFFTGREPVTYTEQATVTEAISNFYGNAEFKFYDEGLWYATFETEFKHRSPGWNQELLLNGFPRIAVSNGTESNFNNHLNITYQADKTLLWENYAYFSLAKNYQDFEGTSILTEEPTLDLLLQRATLEKYYTGFSSRLTLSNARSTTVLISGLENENENFNSRIFQEVGGHIDSLQSYRALKFLNVTALVEQTFHFSKKRDLELSSGVTKKYGGERVNDYLLFRGRLTYSFPIPKAGQFAINYSFNQKLNDFSSLYSGYSLINYRTLKGGIDQLFKINNHSFALTHNYQNSRKGFLMFNILSYTNYDKGYIAQNFVDEAFTLVNLQEGKGGEIFIAQNQLTKYVNAIQTSLKLENGINYFQNYISVNSAEVSPAKNYNLTSSLGGTTYFDIPVNIEFSAGFQYSESHFQDQESSVVNLLLMNRLIYDINKKLIFSAAYRYYNLRSNTHSFLSAELSYKPESSNWEFELSGRNLLNVKHFRTANVSDFHVWERSTRIIPRYLMLTAHWRF